MGLSKRIRCRGRKKLSASAASKSRYKTHRRVNRQREAIQVANSTTRRIAKKTKALTSQVDPKSSRNCTMLLASSNIKAAPMKKKGHPVLEIAPRGESLLM